MRQMKDSGIKWIGEIPADWQIVRTKVCYIHKKQIAGADSDDYERLALTLKGVIKRSKDDSTGLQPEAFNGYQILRENELVFKLIDLENVATSRVGYSPYTGIVSPAYIILCPRKETESKLGEYYFLSMWQREIFNHMGDDGVRSSLNAGDLLNSPYILIPDDEKLAIVQFLDRKCAEIDVVIEKTKATIEEYKKLKQSVITEAVTKGISTGCEMIETEYEWIGSIPSHWKTIKAKWLLGERKERSAEGKEEPLSMSQKFGLIPTKGMDMIPNMAASFVGSKLVYVGDLVFNKLKAHLGVFAVSRCDGLVSPDYAVYYSTGLASVKYLEYLFKTPQYIAEFRKKSSGVGAGLTRLYTDNLFSIYCSQPPMEEQAEIVAYLNKKCAEIDSLISKKTALLEEMEAYKKSVIYEYVTGKKKVGTAVQSTATIIYPYFPAVLSTKKVRFAQAVLMSRILDKCRKKMGRVKLEKMLYTIEISVGFDFDTEYVREAAGPLDGSIYECEGIISRRNKWFAMKSSRHGVSYTPTKDSDKYKKYYDKYFTTYDSEIERIIGIFMDYDADHAEIIATLFAAWNDFIIDQRHFTDEELVDEVLNNWNDSKKRFSKDVWLRAIEQMRKNNIVPKGYGKHTVIKN